ncbi:MAG: U32 family peptidase [Pseudomonadota bacterium]
MNTPRLTLGPLLFHWSASRRRDFYFRIADEAPVDTVYVGEVVCSKREPMVEAVQDEVIARLRAAGKEVVLSTLALVTTPREVERIRERVDGELLLEANDVACIQLLGGRPHVVGPYVNVFNEGAREVVVGQGAVRIVLPIEMNIASLRVVAGTAGSTQIEYQVFGRQPLSVAMRCYHARANNLTKDHCQIICGVDPEGLVAETIDGLELLTVNGTQTLTRGNGVLLGELGLLREAGVTHFRLSPQELDMVAVAALYREVLDGRRDAGEAVGALRAVAGEAPWINGFLHGRPGRQWVEPRA